MKYFGTMLKKSLCFVTLFCAISLGANVFDVGDNRPEKLLIPVPQQVDVKEGVFLCTQNVKIVLYSANLKSEIGTLQETFTKTFGKPAVVIETRANKKNKSAGEIGLVISNSPNDRETLGDEGYVLSVEKEKITLTATTPTGVFYGIQTLRQLMLLSANQQDNKKAIKINGVTIHDRSKFEWRGVMLDPARYFLPTELLKKYINTMCLYKMNRLQLHLTDDLGWTVEMVKYPELNRQENWPQTPLYRNRGMYTRKEIQDLVAYAKERHITIIPELELPGHNAIVGWIKRDILCQSNPYRKVDAVFPNNEAADNHAPEWMEPCVGNEETLKVYENILTEFMELFPGDYIHIGGDEYYGNAWATCPDCQRLIKEKDLEKYDTKERQALFANCKGDKKKYLVYRYLMIHLADFITSKGRIPVLWDDLSWRGDFPKNAIIMQWHYKGGGDAWQQIATPENPAAEAAIAGHKTVVSPYSHLYFDLGSSLKDVYFFDPMPNELKDEASKKLILGPHAPVWNQQIDAVFSQSFPRFYALSQIAWSCDTKKDFTDFEKRVNAHDVIATIVTEGARKPARVIGGWAP